MNERQSYISETVLRWLERRDPPMTLRGEDRTKYRDAERVSLVKTFGRAIPDDDYREVLADTIEVIEFRAKSRIWPTIFDINTAAKEVLKDRPAKPREPFNPVASNVQRMERDEAVPEDWLFGRKSAQLLREGISKQKLDEYRNAALRNRVEVYGEEAAQKWADKRKEYHEAALLAEGEERRAYAAGEVVGGAARKLSVPQIEWFD